MEPTVLFVDDDDNILRGMARALRQQPYQLHTARCAEEAVWTLKTRQLDVIVADDRMPGMSGGDLLAWVAESYPEVVRIVLTGYGTMETAIRAINEGGVFHFFTKPCDVVQLAITIRKALEHKSLRDENRRLAQLHEGGHVLPEDCLQQLDRLEQLVTHELCPPLENVAEADQRPSVRAALQAAAEARETIVRLRQGCRPVERSAAVFPSGT